MNELNDVLTQCVKLNITTQHHTCITECDAAWQNMREHDMSDAAWQNMREHDMNQTSQGNDLFIKSFNKFPLQYTGLQRAILCVIFNQFLTISLQIPYNSLQIFNQFLRHSHKMLTSTNSNVNCLNDN